MSTSIPFGVDELPPVNRYEKSVLAIIEEGIERGRDEIDASGSKERR